MSPRVPRSPSLLLTLTLLVFGCRRDLEAENRAEREENATKVTADSTDDATAPIVNEDFGFRLAPPAAGWKLLREQDARSLNPDAIAGAIHAVNGTCGIVMVERLPGTTLEQAVGFLWQQPLPGLEVESEQDLEFQGVPAKRRVFTAEIQGQAFQYVTTVFIRQDHLYQLMSWSLAGQDVNAQMAFHDAFTLLDGEVRGRSSTRAAVTHADGVGWRIRDGRYESALAGLRLRLPEGWRFIVGAELDQLQSDAEIVATDDGGNVFVALVVERASKDRLEAFAELARQRFLDGKPAVGEPLTREVAGQSVEFRRYQVTPLEYQNGVHVGDDAITSIVAWYPQALHEQVQGKLDAMLPGLERIPAAERAQLHEQLLGAPTGQRRFSADRSFRAGQFFDFEHQLRWTSPPGFWSVDDFDKALAHSAETVMYATELELGVHVAVETWESETDDPAAILAKLIEGDELVSQDTTVADGLTIHRAHIIDRKQSPPATHAFAITKREQQIISIMAWSVDDSPAVRATMEAALTGLDYTPELERTRMDRLVFSDVFYGYSFELPSDFTNPPQIQKRGLGQVAAWTQGTREIVALAMIGATDDEAWMSSFFEQLLRDTVGTQHALGKPERSEGLLGGHPARQLTWKADGVNLHAQVVARDPLVYCMLYTNLNDKQLEQVQASWKLAE